MAEITNHEAAIVALSGLRKDLHGAIDAMLRELSLIIATNMAMEHVIDAARAELGREGACDCQKGYRTRDDGNEELVEEYCVFHKRLSALDAQTRKGGR